MESWERLLQSILHQNGIPGLSYVEREEMTIMKHLIQDRKINKRITMWLTSLGKNQTLANKNEERSEELREQGNKKFKCKDYIASIEYYTLSLQYASWGSKNFSLALGNRSAASFYLEQYKACLDDILLAFKCKYPSEILYKLHLRAAHSYSKLQKKSLLVKILTDLKDYLASNHNLTGDRKRDIENQMNKLLTEAKNVKDEVEINQTDCSLPEPAFGNNSNFSHASIALDLRFSEEKGRYVTSNRDIKKGQILFVEKPFAFVLLDHEESKVVCANCCKMRGLSPIPCKVCSNTLYCSDSCRQEAWSTYHQWECFGNQILLWDQIGIAHLALRTFLKSLSTKNIKRFNEVQNLVTNIKKVPIEDVFAYGVSSLMMVLYLSEHTNFFQTISSNEKSFQKFNKLLSLKEPYQDGTQKLNEQSNIHYVSAILLQSMLQLVCNGHAITRLKCVTSDSNDILSEYQIRVATAIYPSASMMNHSCNPNIINSFKDQYLIVKAMEDIPAGNEVFNCYGPHFRRMGLKDRQDALMSQYCFKCKCEACTLTSLRNFSDKFTKLNCVKCSGPVEMDDGSSVSCLECQSNYEVPKITLLELEKANEFFNSSLGDMQCENLIEALKKARLCLQIRKNHLYEYHELIAQTLDLIGQITAMMGQWLESINSIEISLAATEKRFGSDSIELANECNKMTDVCFKFLKEESNTKSSKYKEILNKTRDYLQRAEKIFKLNYGPWNDSYHEIVKKQDDYAFLLSKLKLS